VEQAGVDVERTLTTRRLLDDHRYQWTHVTSCSFFSAGLIPAAILPRRFVEASTRPRALPGLSGRFWTTDLKRYSTLVVAPPARSARSSTARRWARSSLSSSRRPCCSRRLRSF